MKALKPHLCPGCGRITTCEGDTSDGILRGKCRECGSAVEYRIPAPSASLFGGGPVARDQHGIVTFPDAAAPDVPFSGDDESESDGSGEDDLDEGSEGGDPSAEAASRLAAALGQKPDGE